MTEEMRRDLTPQGYIRKMFEESRDGKLTIVDYTEDEPVSVTYNVSWNEDDAAEIVKRYNLLTAALTRIGRLDKSDFDRQDEGLRDRLSESDKEVFDVYVREYEPFEVDPAVVYEIYDREEEERSEEEKAILDRFFAYREEQSRKRIPFNRRSSVYLIIRANRYEKLVSLKAPELVITEEGRALAEEMVVYYAAEAEPVTLD